MIPIYIAGSIYVLMETEIPKIWCEESYLNQPYIISKAKQCDYDLIHTHEISATVTNFTTSSITGATGPKA